MWSARTRDAWCSFRWGSTRPEGRLLLAGNRGVRLAVAAPDDVADGDRRARAVALRDADAPARLEHVGGAAQAPLAVAQPLELDRRRLARGHVAGFAQAHAGALVV